MNVELAEEDGFKYIESMTSYNNVSNNCDQKYYFSSVLNLIIIKRFPYSLPFKLVK